MAGEEEGSSGEICFQKYSHIYHPIAADFHSTKCWKIVNIRKVRLNDMLQQSAFHGVMTRWNAILLESLAVNIRHYLSVVSVRLTSNLKRLRECGASYEVGGKESRHFLRGQFGICCMIENFTTSVFLMQSFSSNIFPDGFSKFIVRSLFTHIKKRLCIKLFFRFSSFIDITVQFNLQMELYSAGSSYEGDRTFCNPCFYWQT